MLEFANPSAFTEETILDNVPLSLSLSLSFFLSLSLFLSFCLSVSYRFLVLSVCVFFLNFFCFLSKRDWRKWFRFMIWSQRRRKEMLFLLVNSISASTSHASEVSLSLSLFLFLPQFVSLFLILSISLSVCLCVSFSLCVVGMGERRREKEGRGIHIFLSTKPVALTTSKMRGVLFFSIAKSKKNISWYL